jgi:hypothetical protein
METKFVTVTVRQVKQVAVPVKKRSRGVELAVAVLAAALVLMAFILCKVAVAETPEAEAVQETAASYQQVAEPLSANTLEETEPELEEEEQVKMILETAQVVEKPANPWGAPLYDVELTALYETCEAYHMAPELGLAVIEQESSFNRNARNVDCYGLMQLKEKYFPGASVMAPEENIRTGLTYLGELLEKYDDLGAALCAYRWGHDNGDRVYANEVLDKLEKYGAMFG